ncbi:MAG: Sarcosine oxidase(), partial [uncultured Thermomicrobiales bacterium]
GTVRRDRGRRRHDGIGRRLGAGHAGRSHAGAGAVPPRPRPRQPRRPNPDHPPRLRRVSRVRATRAARRRAVAGTRRHRRHPSPPPHRRPRDERTGGRSRAVGAAQRDRTRPAARVANPGRGPAAMAGLGHRRRLGSLLHAGCRVPDHRTVAALAPPRGGAAGSRVPGRGAGARLGGNPGRDRRADGSGRLRGGTADRHRRGVGRVDAGGTRIAADRAAENALVVGGGGPGAVRPRTVPGLYRRVGGGRCLRVPAARRTGAEGGAPLRRRTVRPRCDRPDRPRRGETGGGPVRPPPLARGLGPGDLQRRLLVHRDSGPRFRGRPASGAAQRRDRRRVLRPRLQIYPGHRRGTGGAGVRPRAPAVSPVGDRPVRGRGAGRV